MSSGAEQSCCAADQHGAFKGPGQAAETLGLSNKRTGNQLAPGNAHRAMYFPVTAFSSLY